VNASLDKFGHSVEIHVFSMQTKVHLRKISDTKVAMGLEIAKEGKEFKQFGESIIEKVK